MIRGSGPDAGSDWRRPRLCWSSHIEAYRPRRVRSSAWLPDSTIEPRSMTTIRFERRARLRSWDTMRTVRAAPATTTAR